jgi:hypothetical protein
VDSRRSSRNYIWTSPEYKSEANLLGIFYYFFFLLNRNVNNRMKCAVKMSDLCRLVDDKLRFCEIVLPKFGNRHVIRCFE